MIATVALALVPVSAGCQVVFTGSQFNIGGSGLASPTGVAADGQGNVYIADQGNNRILAVVTSGSATGTLTTVLSGLSSPWGVAADWSGNVYVADTGNNRILMLPVTSTGLGAAVTVGSGFNGPKGVAVDLAGNLYVTDSGNNQVVELPLIGNGFGSPIIVASGFNNPTGVAVDAAADLIVADTGNNRVVKQLHSSVGYLAKQAVCYGLNAPAGVSVDKVGNLYIADSGNGRVLEEIWFAGANRYNSQVIVGSGFTSPPAVAADWRGNVYVADATTNQVVQVLAVSAEFGAINVGVPGPQLTYNFKIAAGTIIGAVGIYTQGVSGADFTDAGASSCIAQTYTSVTYCGINVAFTPLGSGSRMGAVVMRDSLGNGLSTAYITGIGLEPQIAFLPGTATLVGNQLSGPAGVTVDGSGNIYISDTGNNRVVEVPWTGSGYGTQTTVPISGLMSPMGLAVDGAGNLFVVSNGNDKLIELSWTGSGYGQTAKVGSGFYGPTDVAVDLRGNLYVSDTLDNNVNKLPWTGSGYSPSQTVGGYHKFPSGVAVDTSGNVYFANTYLNCVEQVPWTGSAFLIQKEMNLPGIALPAALATDGNSNLYILDSGNNRVLMLPWNGNSFGTPITVASGFNSPGGMAVDGNGNLFVADTGNNQVVEIALSRPGGSTFATTYLGSTSSDSPSHTVVENIGNLPLAIDSVSFPQDFPEGQSGANPCSGEAPVNPGGSCELSIGFTPSTASTFLSESVEIADNNMGVAGALQTITVSGASVALSAQSILFSLNSNVIYGSGPIPLTAVASSGLPVVYQVVSGPGVLNRSGSAVSVTGAGAIVIVATQPGSASVSAAASVTVSVTVAPAVLTVTPKSVTATYGAVPGSFQYTIAGFVLGQNATQSVIGAATVSSGAAGNIGAGIYTLTAAQGTLSAANYTFAFATGTLTVSQAVLNVNATSVSCIYGAGMQALPWTLSGFANGDTASAVTGAPMMTSSGSLATSVGRFVIAPSLGTLSASNYSFNLNSGWLTVTPATLNVTAFNQSITYGQGVPNLTYSISGFVAGDSAANAIKGSPAISFRAATQPAAGTCAIVVSMGSLAATNYVFSFVPGQLLVGQAQLTITPTNAAMGYGSKIPALTYTLSGFVNGDVAFRSVSGSPSLTTTATSQSSVGLFPIVAGTGSLVSSNYSFTFGGGVVTVNRAVLTVVPQSSSMTYGGVLPSFIYTFQGFVNGDSAGAIQGNPLYATSATSMSAVGSYSVVGGIGTLQAQNYSFALLSSTLQVGKATLTVIPGNASKMYGDPMPALQYSLQGFVNGDGANAVIGIPLFQVGATKSSAAGSYPIHIQTGSMSAPNYSLIFGSGELTVSKAVLSVISLPATMTYGGTLPALTYSIKGLVNGDSLVAVTGNPVVVSGATPSSRVGVYSTDMTSGTLSAANYTFTMAKGEITVSKAMLTIVPAASSMTYGSGMPQFTYKLAGFVNGDGGGVVSGVPVFASEVSIASPVGVYVVSATAGTMSAENYTFTGGNGSIAVGKAVLTVIPASVSMTYGGALPKFTYSLQGFVNGDSAESLVGAPTFATAAVSSSPTGTYSLSMSIGSLASANYNIVLLSGQVTISKAVLQIAPVSIATTYGDSLPAFTYTISGFVNGDGPTVVTGAPGFKTEASATSHAGAYLLTTTIGTMTAANYVLSISTGEVVIAKAVLTITAECSPMTYGGAIRWFGYSTQGYVNGDNWRAMSGAPAYSTAVDATSPAGTYALDVSLGSLASTNYIFAFVSGEVVVNKAVLTILPVTASMTYGGALPALTYTLTGFLNGDNATVVSGTPSFTTVASPLAKVGGYQVVAGAGTMAAQSYTFVGGKGEIAVGKAVLTISPVPVSMIYGGAQPAYQYQATGFLNGDTNQAVTGAAHFDTAATSSSAVGTYPVTMDLVDLRAVNYSFISGSGEVTVTPAMLTVAPLAQSMAYGSAIGALTYKIAGFVKGDSESASTTGAPLLTSAATSSSSVGGYSITAVQGTLAAENYIFQFDTGTMMVTQATLTATAANVSMTVGSAVPELTYALSGLVNGDTTVSATTGAAALTTSATAASAAGSYPITITIGSLASINYKFTLANGILTVSQASPLIGQPIPWPGGTPNKGHGGPRVR